MFLYEIFYSNFFSLFIAVNKLILLGWQLQVVDNIFPGTIGDEEKWLPTMTPLSGH